MREDNRKFLVAYFLRTLKPSLWEARLDRVMSFKKKKKRQVPSGLCGEAGVLLKYGEAELKQLMDECSKDSMTNFIM